MRLLPTNTLAGAVCAALVATAAPAHASAFPCFDDAAMQSARIHDLKVNLMVNALKCREVDPMTLRSYGQLLEKRSNEFAGHGLRVKKSLEQRFGARQGTAMFDDYETRIGNYHSGTRPSMEKCDDTAAFIRLANRANSAELETLSRLVTNRGIRACPVPVQTAAFEPVAKPAPRPVTEPAPVLTARWERPLAETPAPVAPAPAPVPEPVAAPAPQMVDGIPTYPAPGIVPDSEPEPMERVAVPAAQPVPEPEPEPPVVVARAEAAEAPAPEASAQPVDREARLAQAITALDAAAAALRGMQDSPADGTK